MTTFSHSVGYLDTAWDEMDQISRETLVLEQLLAATANARERIPFYKAHLSRFAERDIAGISSLEEYAVTIPETTKEHISRNSYRAFLPDAWEQGSPCGTVYNKGTGGTTGSPTTVVFTCDDWRAMAQTLARSIRFDFRESPEKLRGLSVLGLYHGDHITNGIYRDAFQMLEMVMFGRVSTKMDAEANYALIQALRPNALLGPPEDATSQQTKGLTLDSIFRLDARNTEASAYRLNNKANPDFSMIFWSSMPMSEAMQWYILEHLNMPYQQAQYGSTEICPTGATCSVHPRSFHISYGHSCLTVKHPSGKRLAAEGEEGYVLASRTGAITPEGTCGVPRGTTYLNLRTGDAATPVQTGGKQCGCGRTSPVLSNVRRVEYADVKRFFGCQSD